MQTKKRIIMKFGGTSLGGSQQIINTCNIIKSNIRRRPIIVVSAVGGITDKLIDCANRALVKDPKKELNTIFKIHKNILKNLELDVNILLPTLSKLEKLMNEIHKKHELSTKMMDNVLSFGERLSSLIIAGYLNKIGIDAIRKTSYDIGIITDNKFGFADILEESHDSIMKNIDKESSVIVITGFLGKTKNGEITTVGRNGSDYTASIIGAAIGAEEIQIWTDVDGVRTADPRIIRDAKNIEKISFVEASELAYFGAKILHPKTILPAMDKNIPVKVLNTMNPSHAGTTIIKNCPEDGMDVKAITAKRNVLLINVSSSRMFNSYGFLERIFKIFGKYEISIDLISTSEVTLSLTIENRYSKEILDSMLLELKKIGKITLMKKKAIISLVGRRIGKELGHIGRTFNLLDEHDVEIGCISAGASKTNLSFVVSEADVERVLNLIYDEFFRG